MITPNALSTAISGLRAQSARAYEIANNIANVRTSGFRSSDVRTVSLEAGGKGAGVSPKRVDSGKAGDGGDVDLARQITNLIETEIAYKANAKTLQAASDILGRIVNTTA